MGGKGEKQVIKILCGGYSEIITLYLIELNLSKRSMINIYCFFALDFWASQLPNEYVFPKGIIVSHCFLVEELS